MSFLGTTTLQGYLRNRLFVLGILLTLIYGYGMSFLYAWGLDDASEFYLYQDAEMAEELIHQRLPLPVNTQHRKIYLGMDALPLNYRRAVEQSDTTASILHRESDKYFDYILLYPFHDPAKNGDLSTLFIIHTFDLDADKAVPGLSAFEVTLLGSGVAFVFILLTASLIYRAISRSVNTLYCWAIRAEKDYESVVRHQVPEDALRFKELQSVGHQFYDAVNCIVASADREKYFIRSLSHELRTPMAVTSAALDILDKKDLNADILSKLKKIRDANQKMISLSDTLLNIWQDKDGKTELKEINVFDLVEKVIQEHRYIAANTEINIDINIEPSLVIQLPLEPFSIILANLVKNALQYTQKGLINIEMTNERLVVINSSEANQDNKRSQHSEYGFGLGLFIAETVAERQSWHLEYKQHNREFRSVLILANHNDQE